ncbi:hypothetical protein HanXRQr2_Chr16g0766391 [Helianthus annuus]|uniref:Putative pectin lyase fold protein n=1 Tax=Helianthus annuus TaxID=4232 RepID=A0A251S2D7_HELAN|nr:hypothetical protein HanXRQr2_Chr16g0766391 [Helianthus annuus]
MCADSSCFCEPETHVPKGSVFSVSFSGFNCESNILFRLDSKIIAPKRSGSWESGLLQLLEFTKLNGIMILLLMAKARDGGASLALNKQ